MSRLLLAVCLATALVAVTADVGFEYEGFGATFFLAGRVKDWPLHTQKYAAPNQDLTAFKVTVDTRDPEYMIPHVPETDAGRLRLCEATSAVVADMRQVIAAKAAANGGRFDIHGAALQPRSDVQTWAMQTTYGIRLDQIRLMLRALGGANVFGAIGARPRTTWSVDVAMNALWTNGEFAQLNEKMRGFILLLTLVRLGGNANVALESPKMFMDLIPHTTWARIANELNGQVQPLHVGAAPAVAPAPVTERAALLANRPGGNVPWAVHLADAMATQLIADSVAGNGVDGIAAQGLDVTPLQPNMYRGGWSVVGRNINPTFQAWVTQVLTDGVDLTRRWWDVAARIGQRIGDVDRVDVQHGANHIIVEWRIMWDVNVDANNENLSEFSLLIYDWIVRWNTNRNPQRLMAVSSAAAVVVNAGGVAQYTPANPRDGCAIKLSNTCQAATNLASLYARMAIDEATRVAGLPAGPGNNPVAVPACLLDHSSAASTAKRLKGKIHRHTHAHALTDAQCALPDIRQQKPHPAHSGPVLPATVEEVLKNLKDFKEELAKTNEKRKAAKQPLLTLPPEIEALEKIKEAEEQAKKESAKK